MPWYINRRRFNTGDFFALFREIVWLPLYGKNQKLFVIDKNFEEKKQIENTYISLFALTEKIENLNLINLKYELKNFTLKNDMHLGVSNEPIGKEFKIEFDKGMILVIYENKNVYK